jgi:hypothetical protein
VWNFDLFVWKNERIFLIENRITGSAFFSPGPQTPGPFKPTLLLSIIVKQKPSK